MKLQLLLQVNWSVSTDLSQIHLIFLDLLDSLLLLLSTTDVAPFNLVEECDCLMASECHKIHMFSKNFLDRLQKCSSYLLVKVLLLPLFTWLDHSILRHLVLASKSEVAIRILNQFESSIDYKQPISSYPIPSPSQLTVPLDDSGYTLVATKCDWNFEEFYLQQIINIRNKLIQKWEISDFAIQLVAIQTESGFLYWMIPDNLVTIIEVNSTKAEHDLWESGIIMTTVLDSKATSYDKNIVGNQSYPFYFLHAKV